MDDKGLDLLRTAAGEMLGGASLAGLDRIERVLATAGRIGREP
jgi:hypothetical protein